MHVADGSSDPVEIVTVGHLHDLILGEATALLRALHRVATSGGHVLDESKTERTSAILIASEFGCPM